MFISYYMGYESHILIWIKNVDILISRGHVLPVLYVSAICVVVMDKTLLKGLRVLELINELDGQALTIEQLAQQVGLTRSNMHRTLQSLSHAGYVYRDQASGGYRCTLKLFEMGARLLFSLDVRSLAAPFMRELADQTGESVHLSVLEGMDVVYIDKIDSPQPIRAYSVIGGRAPAYAVATGKAMLSFQPADYLVQYQSALQQHTASTHIDLAFLRNEFRQVQVRGYAENHGEWRDGVGGLAAPLFNGLNKVVAALGISGPLDRLSSETMKKMAPLVLHSAQALSSQLGYQGEYFDLPKERDNE